MSSPLEIGKQGMETDVYAHESLLADQNCSEED